MLMLCLCYAVNSNRSPTKTNNAAKTALFDYFVSVYSILSPLFICAFRARFPRSVGGTSSAAHLLDFAHHFGCLLELLEEAVDLDNRSARTFGNTVLAAAVEQSGVGALLGGH